MNFNDINDYGEEYNVYRTVDFSDPIANANNLFDAASVTFHSPGFDIFNEFDNPMKQRMQDIVDHHNYQFFNNGAGLPIANDFFTQLQSRFTEYLLTNNPPSLQIAEYWFLVYVMESYLASPKALQGIVLLCGTNFDPFCDTISIYNTTLLVYPTTRTIEQEVDISEAVSEMYEGTNMVIYNTYSTSYKHKPITDLVFSINTFFSDSGASDPNAVTKKEPIALYIIIGAIVLAGAFTTGSIISKPKRIR